LPAAEPTTGEGKGSLTRDFLTGCGTLVGVGLIVVMLVPIVLVVAEASLHAAAPLAVFGLGMLMVALFGRGVRYVRERWR